MGKHVEREVKNNFMKWNAASHNNASWCTDTGGLLEHSSGARSLYYKGPTPQKVIPGFGGIPLICFSIFVLRVVIMVPLLKVKYKIWK